MLTEKQGKELVEVARRSIELFVRKGEKLTSEDMEVREHMKNKRGIFVTIKTEEGDLRGCIGQPYPRERIIGALLGVSRAVTEDPRFSPLTEDELKDVEVEVTVLTEPELIDIYYIKEAEGKIKLGKHGLIVKKGLRSGLLLPQVPEEHGMNLKEFLEATCLKAGLSRNSWMEEETGVYRFEGQVFEENGF